MSRRQFIFHIQDLNLTEMVSLREDLVCKTCNQQFDFDFVLEAHQLGHKEALEWADQIKKEKVSLRFVIYFLKQAFFHRFIQKISEKVKNAKNELR